MVGTVTAVPVPVGRAVVAGAALATLDPADLQSAVNVASTTTPQHVVATASTGTATTQSSAAAALISAQSKLATAQKALGGATLTSTIAGTVASVTFGVGTQVGSGRSTTAAVNFTTTTTTTRTGGVGVGGGRPAGSVDRGAKNRNRLRPLQARTQPLLPSCWSRAKRNCLEISMSDTTCHMSILLDGFVAGPEQSQDNPLGKRGLELHGWHVGDPRAPEVDTTATGWRMRPRGAYVMGRNMFGLIRGAWNE